MHVRAAEESDLDALMEMARRFHAATKYRQAFEFNDEQVLKTITWVMANGMVFVLEDEGQLVGEFGIAIVPQVFSGAPTASEVFWWTDPEVRGSGKRLFDVAVEWSKAQGATSIQLVSPDDRVDLFYQRLGCQKIETVFRLAL